MARLFSFPNPVDEVSARLVAGGVVVLSPPTWSRGWTPLVVVLALGFLARVLSGPTLSPLGQLVTRVIRPALPIAARPTAGPPKRFAQGIGATLSSVAVLAAVGFGSIGVAQVLVAMVTVAASLESFLGFCLGCKAFALLMRLGVIPETVCEECNDISARLARSRLTDAPLRGRASEAARRRRPRRRCACGSRRRAAWRPTRRSGTGTSAPCRR